MGAAKAEAKEVEMAMVEMEGWMEAEAAGVSLGACWAEEAYGRLVGVQLGDRCLLRQVGYSKTCQAPPRH